MRRRLRLGFRDVCQLIEFSYQKFLRWRNRLSQGQAAKQKPGPKKIEAPDLSQIRREIEGLRHCSQRSHGMGRLIQKYKACMSRRSLRKLVRYKRQEIKRERRQALDHIHYEKVSAVWSMDDSMIFRDESGRKMTMHVIRDLSSKYQFAKPSRGILSGE